MIDLSQHFEYIGGAYLITMVLVGALVVLVQRDYHTQAKRLKELEAKGFRRRSQETPQGDTSKGEDQ